MTTRLGKGDTILADVRTLPRRRHTYEDGLRSLTPLNHPFEKQISPDEATRRWRITRERASVDTRRRRDHSPSSATSNPCRAAPLENRGGKKRKPPRCCNCFRQQGLTRKRKKKKAKRSRRRLAKASRRWLIGHYRFWFATEIGVRPSVCVDMQPRLLIKKKKREKFIPKAAMSGKQPDPIGLCWTYTRIRNSTLSKLRAPSANRKPVGTLENCVGPLFFCYFACPSSSRHETSFVGKNHTAHFFYIFFYL